jgi:CAP-Gly domain
MLSLGDRLSILSFLCTVLYIGPVEGTTGTWLGVEWDDSSRGKHSGTHNGYRYFTTKYLLLPSSGINYLDGLEFECRTLIAEFQMQDHLSDQEKRLMERLPFLMPSIESTRLRKNMSESCLSPAGKKLK